MASYIEGILKESRTRTRTLESQIEEVIKQLDKWINETYSGGWSTQHVSQMQRTANRLRGSLNRKEKDYEAKRSNSIVENI